jgi:hypothetical protein
MQQQNQTGYPNPPQIVTHPPSEDGLSEKAAPAAIPPHEPLPSDPPFVAQRKQIEQRLGPNCHSGGYHELRMHYTNETLCCAFFLLPALCGYRGKREVSLRKSVQVEQYDLRITKLNLFIKI